MKLMRFFVVLFLAFLTALLPLQSINAVHAAETTIVTGEATSPLQVDFFDVSAESGYSFPRQLVIGPDGDLWFIEDVLSQDRHQTDGIIAKISTDGSVTGFQVPGIDGSSQMVVGTDGNFWFTQPNVNKIGKLTPNGFLTEYELPKGRCTYPSGITVGPDGHIWFVETTQPSTGCVKQSFLAQFTSEEFITEYQIPGINMGYNIHTGQDGNLWISGGAENSMIKATVDPVSYTIFPTSGYPQNVVVGKHQDFWFSQYFTNYVSPARLGHITTDGVVSEFPVTNTEFIIALASDVNGDLWFMDLFANKLSKMDRQGNVTSYPLSHSLVHATDMIFGPDGNIWFVESQSGRIGRINLASLAPTSTSTPTPTTTPEPTLTPTEEPTVTPTSEPTATPTPEVTLTPEPTTEPTPEPTPGENTTEEPTPTVTQEPTIEPTATPTVEPTAEPTSTPAPTVTPKPTATPTSTSESTNSSNNSTSAVTNSSAKTVAVVTPTPAAHYTESDGEVSGESTEDTKAAIKPTSKPAEAENTQDNSFFTNVLKILQDFLNFFLRIFGM